MFVLDGLKLGKLFELILKFCFVSGFVVNEVMLLDIIVNVFLCYLRLLVMLMLYVKLKLKFFDKLVLKFFFNCEYLLGLKLCGLFGFNDVLIVL